MAQKVIKIDEEQYDQLSAIKERDGIPMAEQVRRAIDMWLSIKLREPTEADWEWANRMIDELGLEGE